MVKIKNNKDDRIKTAFDMEFDRHEIKDVSPEVAEVLLKGDFSLVDGKQIYTKEELSKLGMKELRAIGAPLGAKDTSKDDLIEEILKSQNKK